MEQKIQKSRGKYCRVWPYYGNRSGSTVYCMYTRVCHAGAGVHRPFIILKLLVDQLCDPADRVIELDFIYLIFVKRGVREVVVCRVERLFLSFPSIFSVYWRRGTDRRGDVIRSPRFRR